MTPVNHPSVVCDEPPLEVLLRGDESSAEFRRLADHIECCARCQGRLTRLAADDAEWRDISSLLRGYPPAADFAGRGGAAPVQVSQSDLSFLALPSHPEMLGRLGIEHQIRAECCGKVGRFKAGHGDSRGQLDAREMIGIFPVGAHACCLTGPSRHVSGVAREPVAVELPGEQFQPIVDAKTRDVLGFEVRQDVGYNGMRWLTVGPVGQPETNIVLEPFVAGETVPTFKVEPWMFTKE